MKTNAIANDIENISIEDLPSIKMMKIIGSPDQAHFISNMKFYTEDIVKECDVAADSQILDLGSGCGRLALGFSQFLDKKGRYIGVDVWQAGVKWCRENITTRFPNFEFHHISVVDNYYYSTWRKPSKRSPNRIKLDFIQDSSLDVCFAISVFTHLVPEDARTYLNEFRRMIKESGKIYVTFFVIDQEVRDYIERTGEHRDVLKGEAANGVFTAYKGQLFFCGYSRPRLEAMIKEAKLKVLRSSPGSWAQKKNARIYQDYFLLAPL